MLTIRRQVQDEEITADSAKKALTAIVGEEMAERMASGGFGAGRGGARPAGVGRAEEGATAGEGEVTGRRAFVFVVSADGSITPQPVTLGIGDYDQTEVMAGLDEGAQVALIGAAQLQAQQAEFLNRIRSRSSGPFGGGGPPLGASQPKDAIGDAGKGNATGCDGGNPRQRAAIDADDARHHHRRGRCHRHGGARRGRAGSCRITNCRDGDERSDHSARAEPIWRRVPWGRTAICRGCRSLGERHPLLAAGRPGNPGRGYRSAICAGMRRTT